MKALSLWQPWASLVVAGVKTIETRSWSTDHRGPLAIHAARIVVGEDKLPPEVVAIAHRFFGEDWNEKLERGAAIGRVELVDVQPMIENPRSLAGVDVAGVELITLRDQYLGDFRPGRFAWILRGAEPFFQSVPMVGRQRLFETK